MEQRTKVRVSVVGAHPGHNLAMKHSSFRWHYVPKVATPLVRTDNQFKKTLNKVLYCSCCLLFWVGVCIKYK